MRRGTTPTLELTLTGVDAIASDKIYVTLKQSQREITKTNEDLSIESGESESVINLYLSQQETLSLRTGTCEIQVRGINALGDAWASDIATINIKEILRDGVINYD